MNWVQRTWRITYDKTRDVLDALCDYGVNPFYIECFPSGKIMNITIECTDDKLAYLESKGVFMIGVVDA